MKYKCSMLTDRDLIEWWENMQNKGADYLRIVKPSRIYMLEACKHGIKGRVGQISLATVDSSVAEKAKSRLLISIKSFDPETVVAQYNAHKQRMVDGCRDKTPHLRLLGSRTKTAKTNGYRLKSHLLPFCKAFGIHSVVDLYRRDVVGRYIEYLQETVVEAATANAIMKTTKAFLHWFDSLQETQLANREFEQAVKGYSAKFGYKQRKVKPFLDDNVCMQLLATESDDLETRAMVLSHLVGGLRDCEMMGLRWSHLDLKNRCIAVLDAKGGVARYCQYPAVLQDAFERIRHERTCGIFANDFIFSECSYAQRNARIKAYIAKAVGIVGKDIAGNCLRRTGCNTINIARPGLADRQLGHSVNSRITDLYYCNPKDFRDLNGLWDGFSEEAKKFPRRIVNVADMVVASSIVPISVA